MAPIPTFAREELLKATTSRCPVCHAACPAEVWRVTGNPPKVYLKRTCPTHGEASVCIASDARFYWLAKGNPENGCCGGGKCGPVSDAQFIKAAAFSSADFSVAGTLGRNAAG